MIHPRDETMEDRAPDIVGIGVSVWDSILLIDRHPKAGEVVRASQRVEGIGGGVTVAIATAARLGSKTAMVDALGDDAASNRIIRMLRREGVDTDPIARVNDHTASIASIWTESETAERTIVYSPGTASESLVWSETIERAIANAKVIHLNGRHASVCMKAITFAKQRGTRISFDGGAYRYRRETLPMLRAADVAIVARQFAESYCRDLHHGQCPPQLDRLTEFLAHDLRCEVAVVTDGAGGSHGVGSEGETFFQPAIEPHRAVDTTGCGDTYHGAFLHAMVGGASPSSAALLASKIAAKNAQAMGGFAFTNP